MIQSILTRCAFAAALAVAALPAARAAFPLPGINSNSTYVQYYGTIPDPSGDPNGYNAKIATLGQYNVIVLQADIGGVTPRVVADLKALPNVKYVLGYISIGEDAGANPIVVGNGDGPVMYNGSAIVKSGSGSSYASFYLDQQYNFNSQTYVSDGVPDTNGNFASRYVIPNSDWQYVLNEQRIGGAPGTSLTNRTGTAGLKQLAGARDPNNLNSKSANYGFDGFFLDTLDTAGPFGGVGSYAWTEPAMSATVKWIHDTYPTKYVFANRGLFFYNPAVTDAKWGYHPYDYNIREYIHAALFESYFLTSDPTSDSAGSANQPAGSSPYFLDNLNQYAPKLTSEAGRPDGFTVFSIDYEMNRGSSLYTQAVANSANYWGWTQYLCPTAGLDVINSDNITTYRPAADTVAPIWSSTGSGSSAAVPARVGLQSLTQGDNASAANLTWDLARDQSGPVAYNIYVSTDSNFTAPVKYPSLAFFQVNGAYKTNIANACNFYSFGNLNPGTYYFRVRAADTAGREETNMAQASITIGGSTVSRITNPFKTGSITLDGNTADWNTGGTAASFPQDPADATAGTNKIDWKSVSFGHDAANIYVQANFWHAISGLDSTFIIFLDTDLKRSTGYVGTGNNFGMGADYMINGTTLYKYNGTGTSYVWTTVGTVAYAYNVTTAEISFPRSWIGNSTAFGVLMYGDNATTTDLYPDNALSGGAYYSYYVPDVTNLVPDSPAMSTDASLARWTKLTSFGLDPADVAAGTNEKLDLLESLMAHDSTNFYVELRNKGPFPALTNAAVSIYLDTDDNVGTGYNVNSNGTVGADYMIQGSTLYKYSGTGGAWGWTSLGAVTTAINGNNAEFVFTRASVGNPGLTRIRIITDNTYLGGSGTDAVPSDLTRALYYRVN